MLVNEIFTNCVNPATMCCTGMHVLYTVYCPVVILENVLKINEMDIPYQHLCAARPVI